MCDPVQNTNELLENERLKHLGFFKNLMISKPA